MSIKIVTDSTCDLPEELVAEHGITVVPLYINVGDQSFLDGVEISRQEFYERLPDFDPPPTTAVPGTERFHQVYRRLADEGATEILSMHISISLSAVVDVARQAAKETHEVTVTALDSRQLSLGTGFLVLAAARAAAAGQSMPEIIALVEGLIPRTHVFAGLDTLEFLRRSGRMNWAISHLGNLLKIKPLLKMHDGEPTAENVRTRRRAIRRLIELVSNLNPLEELALVHTHAPERAEALRREAAHLFPEGRNSLSAEVTPVIGAHIGPGAVGFACVEGG